MKVVYTNREGFSEVREVPNGLPSKDYDKGILIGPPDLSPLKLKKEDRIKLTNALVKEGFLSWKDFSGRRHVLMTILGTIVPDRSKKIELRNKIFEIYQKDYFSDI